MKKFVLAALLAAGSISASYAQLHLGVKGGANFTKIDGVSFNDKFELGYQAGGFLYYDATDFIGLQTEVLFSQTNTKVSDRFRDVFGDAFKGGKTLNYVTVPVLLRLNTQGLITVTAGPQFSFLADGNESFSENSRKLFKKTDFALAAGAEINLHPLIIYGRYVWGFSDISDVGEKAKSQQFQLGLGLRLF